MGPVEIPVQERQGVDLLGRSRVQRSSSLQHHRVSRPGHGQVVRVLQGGDAGVRRKGVQEDHLIQGLDVGKEANDVVHELRRQAISQIPGLPSLTGQLPWRSAKVTKKGVAGFGVRRRSRSPDDRVNCGTCSRGEEGKKGVKTALLRGIEVS